MRAMLAFNEPGHLQTAGSPGVHKGKLRCAELFTELPFNKTHLDSSQLSPVELPFKPTLLFAKVCGKVWMSINFLVLLL